VSTRTTNEDRRNRHGRRFFSGPPRRSVREAVERRPAECHAALREAIIASTDGITTDELQLALRNSGMPLEALRWPITPPGLHYLLTHYDIPAVDAAEWQLEVGGCVDRPLELSLPELQLRPSVTVPVTMECAGNGRARMDPRPQSQPWLTEAVGTAEWTGTPLAPLLREAGPAEGAVEVLFTGLDHGVEGGVAQAYQRSLPLAEALDAGAMLAWAIGDTPLPPRTGFRCGSSSPAGTG
jgi:sulfane dehydrogenase subunit SoxC